MNGHDTIYETQATALGKCRALCSCGKTSDWYVRQQEADDWVIRHRNLVEKGRCHTRQSSLKSECEWFEAQAVNPQNTPEEQDMWKNLAEELGRRLGKFAPPSEQGRLF